MDIISGAATADFIVALMESKILMLGEHRRIEFNPFDDVGIKATRRLLGSRTFWD